MNGRIWDCKRARLLNALVCGFKTRLLLDPAGNHKGLKQLRGEIRRAMDTSDGKAIIIDVNDRLTLKNLMKRRRQKVIELIRMFNKAFSTKNIIAQLLLAKRTGKFAGAKVVDNSMAWNPSAASLPSKSNLVPKEPFRGSFQRKTELPGKLEPEESETNSFWPSK